MWAVQRVRRRVREGIVDALSLLDVRAGAYVMKIGMYDVATQVRFAVSAADGAVLPDGILPWVRSVDRSSRWGTELDRGCSKYCGLVVWLGVCSSGRGRVVAGCSVQSPQKKCGAGGRQRGRGS